MLVLVLSSGVCTECGVLTPIPLSALVCEWEWTGSWLTRMLALGLLGLVFAQDSYREDANDGGVGGGGRDDWNSGVGCGERDGAPGYLPERVEPISDAGNEERSYAWDSGRAVGEEGGGGFGGGGGMGVSDVSSRRSRGMQRGPDRSERDGGRDHGGGDMGSLFAGGMGELHPSRAEPQFGRCV
jgi:hypothetical protein